MGNAPSEPARIDGEDQYSASPYLMICAGG
jgi:hypothetical protein